MDLSKLNQLDPKLKETYERVMGTSTRPAAPTQPVAPRQPQPMQPIQPQPIPQPVQSARPQPTAQAQPVQAQPIQKTQMPKLKKKNKMLPIFIALGFVFLIGYAFFWIKIFNLNLQLP